MFRKLNLKTLVIILTVLVAIYFIADMVGGNDRTFRSEIVKVDTANVTDIYISILKDKAEIRLKRTGGPADWEVSSAGSSFVADPNIVKNILAQFTEMKPERIAATSKDKWAQFEVSDSTGTHVIVKDGNSELANVYVGKFSYSQPPAQAQQQQNPYQQQQRGKMTSFIRVNKEDEVYAVEGFLKMTYQKDINSYRQKSLVNVNKDDLTRLVFNYPGFSTFSLIKNDTKWLLDGVVADSAKTAKYLTKIARLTSSDFLPPSTLKTGEATYKLTIEGNNISPIEIKAFPSDTLVKFVMTSSANVGAEFNGGKGKLFEKVFVDQTEFLAGEPTQK
jgi:hypothetical protein